MLLGMEIPTAHLDEVSALTDIDFALAHLVLENEQYAEFYRKQSDAGRIVILDNSFHELGAPLSSPELLAAARRIQPSVIVAPDKLGQAKWNWDQFEQLTNICKGEFHVGIVVAGNDHYDRLNYVSAALSRKCIWFFWPYKEPRLQWMHELWRLQPSLRAQFHHMLGVSTLEELHQVQEFQFHHYERGVSFSYDTCKPLKFGYRGIRFHKGLNLRGAGPLDHGMTLNELQLRDTFYNIAYMRRAEA